jgi:hypothetical protein
MSHVSHEPGWVSVDRNAREQGLAFGLAPEVLAAVGGWPLLMREGIGPEAWVVCGRALCLQGIVRVSTAKGAYRMCLDDVRAQVLAHVMQRHGWTRETVGDTD